jgi:hypothetical protein
MNHPDRCRHQGRSRSYQKEGTVLPDSTFEKLGIADVADRLKLEGHFYDYTERGGKNSHVRHYLSDARIEGDIDLDRLCWDGVAGIWVEGDLIVDGTIFNWEMDTMACFLAIGRDLRCKNLVASSADIRIARDVRIDGLLSSTYNHGYLEVGRNAHARHIIIDDHATLVRGKVDAGGWKDAEHVEIALPVSAWIDEVRPEFRAEFFDSEGDMLCGNGNVDLVNEPPPN